MEEIKNAGIVEDENENLDGDGLEIKGEGHIKDDMSISFEEPVSNREKERQSKQLDMMMGKIIFL